MNELDVFTAALELTDSAARSRFLAEACSGQPELRSRIDALLRNASDASRYLESPLQGIQATIDEPLAVERPGTQIGSYKLLQQIGEGGMGVVYMAEQTEPIARRVALKIIKPGMDTRLVIARFEAERQALALMDHVNIARVLDAGTTSAGRPYFVMELINGVPITKYCDDNRLTPRQRLELFVPVCQAIQHAHQKGIIHRDIKPSNVMVTLYDGKPVPKVIDFGVAKATEQRLTEQTLFTQYGTLVGTLEYMSPEQAEMSALGVDTRSDIYSLGVLLYELLTGSTPLSYKRLKGAAYGEMLRMIKEEEPQKPSTRVSDSGEALASISAQRQTEPAKLSRLMRGELDWIVMKCLEKDRARRYETANGFAADVQRYLADEAVQACPPSARYRLLKFVRRNKRAMLTSALVVLAFLVAAGTLGWAIRDRASASEKMVRERSAQQAKRNHDIELSLHEARTLDERAATLTEDLHQWEAMLTAALSAVRQVESLMARDEAAVDPALREQIAEVRARLESADNDRRFVARYEQVRIERTQVDVVRSRFAFDRLPELLEGAFAQYGIRREDLSPAEAAAVIGQRPAAVRDQLVAALYDWFYTLPRSAVAHRWLKDLLAAADADPWRTRVLQAMGDRDEQAVQKLFIEDAAAGQPPSFLILIATGLPPEMEAVMLDLLRRVQQAHPGDFWANHELAFALQHAQPPRLEEAIRYYTAALALRPRNPGVYVNLGVTLNGRGDFKGAITAYRQALAINSRYTAAHHNLGGALGSHGDLNGAVAAYRDALALDPTRAQAAFELGNVLEEKGDEPGATAAFRQAIAAEPKHAKAHHNLANRLHKKGHTEGEAFYREAVRHYRESIALDPTNPFPLNGLGNVFKTQGDLKGAIEQYQLAIKVDPQYSQGHFNLGIAWDAAGKPDEAVDAYRRAIALDPGHAQAHSNLGNVLSNLGDLVGAIEHFRQALALMSESAVVHNNLGLALIDKGELDAGIDHCRKAIVLDSNLAAAHDNLGRGLNLLRELDLAIASYRKAAELSPKNANIHSSLGDALYRQGNLDDAVVSFRKVVELKPRDSMAHFRLGIALYGQGDEGKAIASLQKAVELDPNNVHAHANLGTALNLQGKANEAISSLRKVVELDPMHVSAHHDLAWLLATSSDPKVRDVKRAVELARKAVELSPKEGNYWNTLGVMHYRADDWTAAIASLEKAIELRNGGDATEWFILGMSHWQLGKKEEARKWYDRALAWMEKNNPKDEELRRFREEAAALMKIVDDPSTKPNSK